MPLNCINSLQWQFLQSKLQHVFPYNGCILKKESQSHSTNYASLCWKSTNKSVAPDSINLVLYIQYLNLIFDLTFHWSWVAKSLKLTMKTFNRPSSAQPHCDTISISFLAARCSRSWQWPWGNCLPHSKTVAFEPNIYACICWSCSDGTSAFSLILTGSVQHLLHTNLHP